MRANIADQTAGYSYVVVPSEFDDGFYVEFRDHVTGSVDLLPPWFSSAAEAAAFIASDLR